MPNQQVSDVNAARDLSTYVWAFQASHEEQNNQDQLKVVVDAPNGNITPVFLGVGETITIHERTQNTRVKVAWETSVPTITDSPPPASQRDVDWVEAALPVYIWAFPDDDSGDGDRLKVVIDPYNAEAAPIFLRRGKTVAIREPTLNTSIKIIWEA